MANLPEKNVVLVDKITNVPTDSNLFINANGEFKQASVNDVVNSSTVVSTAVETAINTAVQDSIDSNFKQTSGSPILLTDSAEGVLTDFKAYGKSVQNGEPTPDNPINIKSVADGGYFDGELLQGTYQSTTGIYTSNYNFVVCSKNKIPCKAGDVIKIDFKKENCISSIRYWNNGTYVSYEDNKESYIVPSGVNEFAIIMQDSTSSPITPSTVGHITVTINGKYALIVKSKGKNKLDITKYKTLDNEVVTIDGDTIIVGAKTNVYGVMFSNDNIGLRVGETYVFSVENVVNYDSNGGHGFRFHYADGTYNNMSGLALTTTIEKEVSNVIFYLGAPYTGKLESRIEGLMIRPAGTDDTYEPYKESVTYIPLNEPIRSSLDGSVSDVASLSEVTRRFAEVVLDGSDDEVIIAFGNDYPHLFRISVNGVKETRVNVICTHFLSHRKANSDYSKNMIYTFNDHILINHMDITTVAEFKAWLQANPITVQYELAEPTVETIEPVDIVTYDNVTYLTASDNAEMEIEYPTTKVAGIASIGYSKGIKAEYETEQLKKQLLEIQATIVNTL